MPKPVNGGCKCGQVRYEGVRIDAPMFRCHCRDCQKLTGSGHAEMLPLARDTFSISGPYKTYEMEGGSGRSTFSGFCANCGSQLTRNSERSGDRIYAHASSLDDPATYTPERSIYADDAPLWDQASVIKSPS